MKGEENRRAGGRGYSPRTCRDAKEFGIQAKERGSGNKEQSELRSNAKKRKSPSYQKEESPQKTPA